MGKYRSVSGKKVKWVNYKTGVKDIYFRLECDKKQASIGIELQHKDEGIRDLFFEQFRELKRVLEAETNEEWNWETEAFTPSGTPIYRICTVCNGVNVYRKDDWREIFNFFEPRMVALDRFWVEFGEIFVLLSK